MLSLVSSSIVSRGLQSSHNEDETFSLPEARLAQVSVPVPSGMAASAAARLAAEAVKAAYTKAPAVGAAGFLGAAGSSFAEHIFARLRGTLPPNVSTREIQMASVGMNDLKLSADSLSHLRPEQKVFFVKTVASLVEAERGRAAPTPHYMGALRMLLEKAGGVNPAQIDRITPAEADRMFGLRQPESTPGVPMRSSFPGSGANHPNANGGILVNPGAPDFRPPTNTGRREPVENLSPSFMQVDRPKLRGQRDDNERSQPFGDTLTPAQIDRMTSILVSGHSYQEHISEFEELGIHNHDELKQHLTRVLQNMGLTSQTKVVDGKRLVYDLDSNTIVVFNAETGHPITMFRPSNGSRYYYEHGKNRR